MYYTAVHGDTLWSIAEKFSLDPEILAQANCINQNDQINAGNIIFIPYSTSNPAPIAGANANGRAQGPLISQQISIADAYPLPPFYFQELDNYLHEAGSVNPSDFEKSDEMGVQSAEAVGLLPESIGIIARYAANEGLAAAIQNPACTTHLAYFYSGVNENGTFSEDEIPEVLVQMRKLGAKVFGGVTTLNGSRYSRSASACIGSDDNSQLIKAISDSAKSHEFDGIMFDISPLYSGDFRGIVSFVKAFKEEVGCDIPVSMMINADDVSLMSSDAESDPSLVQDLRDNVDFFVVQYFYRNDNGQTNLITPSSWMKAKLNETRDVIGLDKVSVCLGSYGLDMKAVKSDQREADEYQLKFINDEEVCSLASRFEVDMQEALSCEDPSFEYTDSDGFSHEVRFESEFSLEKKLIYAKDAGASSVSLWRLGITDQSVMRLFRDFIQL